MSYFFNDIHSFFEDAILRSLFIVIHFLGHADTHSPHTMHLKASSSQLLLFLLTIIASAGHFLAHNVQYIQLESSHIILPLNLSKVSLLSYGYNLVTGFEKKFFKTSLNIFDIINTYLSVQLMQGSMVNISTGISASLLPGTIFNNGGILAKVGVRIFNLARFFVPLPLI
jgi:hypothetical protein